MALESLFLTSYCRYHNGELLDRKDEGLLYEKVLNAGKKTVSNVVTESKLRIPCATKKHRGFYTCAAFNGHSRQSHTIRVSVGESFGGGGGLGLG